MNTRLSSRLLSVGLVAAAGWSALPAGAQNGAALPAIRETQGVRYLSGGVSAGEAQAISDEANRYSLSLTFLARAGSERSFLAAVPVRIDDAQGRTVLITIAQGPYLLVNLPEGDYTVMANHNGETRTAKAQVRKGQRAQLSFDWVNDQT